MEQKSHSLQVPANEPVVVVITGAAGNIGYSLTFMVAQGLLLGPKQSIELHLLELPFVEAALKGMVLELEDCAFPLVSKIVPTTDPTVAFKNAQICLLVGAKPRGPGMERKDLLTQNALIFRDQGKIINDIAHKDVKVVVVGNPANTNALILALSAPKIPRENITALTRLDQNRAIYQLSQKLGKHVTDIKKVIIWGNHSSTQFPDINHSVVVEGGKEVPAISLINDQDWTQQTLIPCVQKRGAQIIEARKISSAASAANAICNHIRDWVLGSPSDDYVSMGIWSDGSYGVPVGINFSFPLVCRDGKYEIIKNLHIDETSQKMLDLTTKELLEEKEIALQAISNQNC